MASYIDDHRDVYGVEPICRVLPIAPSTYFEHKAKEANPDRCSLLLCPVQNLTPCGIVGAVEVFMRKGLLVLAAVGVCGCGFEPASQEEHRVLVRASTSWRAVQTPGDTIIGQGVMVLMVGEQRPWCVEVERIDPADSSNVFLRLYRQTGGTAAPTVEIETANSNTAGVGARVCLE